MQRQLSLLVGVQYIDKLLMYSCYAVTGSLHGALLHSAWLNSEYMFCVSSWVLSRVDLVSYVKGNSDSEVVSCPALRACVRVVLNVVSRAGGRTWKLDITSTSPLHMAGLFSRFRCCLRSWVDFFWEPSMTHNCEPSRARARLALRGHANSYLHHVDIHTM